jgi:glycosyltransferase involved in cell wall biosynthesis
MNTSGSLAEMSDVLDGQGAPVGSRRRIRVVYCVAGMEIGGTELNALRTAVRLDRTHFEPVCATLVEHGPLRQHYDNAGITVLPFPITSLYNRTTVREGTRFFRFVRQHRIDIVHCHDMYTNVFVSAWARLARVPVLIASRRWIHPVDDQRLELANRISYRLADRVLGNSSAVTQLLHERDGVRASRILHIPNFVDEVAFDPLDRAVASTFRKELQLPDDAQIVGCIARLVPVKGHDVLLQAVSQIAARYPKLYLLLIGDGRRRQELEQLAHSLGIAQRTRFLGSRPNIPNLNQLFDITALASFSEGFPNSLVEAMAAGRPVVATAVGGNPDAVRASTGMLVAPGNAEALARGLDRLLSDEPLRQRMGAAAIQVARTEYHADTVIPRLESTYRELLGQSRRPVAPC